MQVSRKVVHGLGDDADMFKLFVSGIKKDPTKTIISKIDSTVKTHKPRGEVNCRILHKCVQHPMVGAMRWLSSLLRSSLNTLPHLVTDTPALIALLSSTRVPGNHKMYKINVKDFYMSGTHMELATRSALSIDPATRPWFRELSLTVLFS